MQKLFVKFSIFFLSNKTFAENFRKNVKNTLNLGYHNFLYNRPILKQRILVGATLISKITFSPQVF